MESSSCSQWLCIYSLECRGQVLDEVLHTRLVFFDQPNKERIPLHGLRFIPGSWTSYSIYLILSEQ